MMFRRVTVGAATSLLCAPAPAYTAAGTVRGKADSQSGSETSSARAEAEALRREQAAEEALIAEKRKAREAERAVRRKELEGLSEEELEQRRAAIIKKRKEELRTTRKVLGAEQTPALHVMKAVVGKGTAVLPVAIIFAFLSVAYVIYESAQRHKNPVCVDCNRQREIAEEVYFGKKTRHVARQMS